MKAYVLHAVGDLRYEDAPTPECPEGWALVRVKAAGICSSDVPRIFTKGTYHFPTIPGHEFSGVVESVGSPADWGLCGRPVGVFPLIPCRRCPQCEAGNYEMCDHYDYVGSRRDGGFAELVAVPVWNLLPLPEGVSPTVAAMLEPLAVALHAVKRSRLAAGQSACVVGTGMIGIGAALWARMLGASTADVVVRNEAKRRMVERLGLTAVAAVDACAGRYDVAIEAVGTPGAVAQAVGLTAPGGTAVLMGNPSGDITLAQDVYWRVLRKQITLRGTWNSSYHGAQPSDWTEAAEAIARGAISPERLVTHVFAQNELGRGLEIMRAHSEPYCKIMTTWN